MSKWSFCFLCGSAFFPEGSKLTCYLPRQNRSTFDYDKLIMYSFFFFNYIYFFIFLNFYSIKKECGLD